MNARVAILLGALAVAPAAPAAALTVVAPAGPAYDPFALAADRAASGRALVAWTVDAPRTVVQVAERGRGRRFGRRTTLGPGRAARASLSPDGGRAAVGWLDDGRLRIAVRLPRARWRGERLPPGLPEGQALRLSDLEMRRDGGAVAALEIRDPDRYRVVVLERGAGPGGRWRRAADLVVPDSAGGQSAVDGAGAVTVVWLAVDGGGVSELVAARHARGAGAFERPVVVVRGTPDQVLAEPQIAAGEGPRVAVLASVESDEGATAGARVATRRAGAPWAVSRPWPASAVAVGADEVWAARLAGGRRETSIVARRLTGDGAWSPAELARGAAGRRIVGGPGLAVARRGAPLAWWVVDGGRSRDGWYSSVRRRTRWSAPAALGATDGGVEFGVGGGGVLAVLVAPQGGGRVVAVDAP